MSKGFIIAIDGPVASGKGTIAPLLAQRLDGYYLYTGGFYRALALYCLQNNIDIQNEEAILQHLSDVHIEQKGTAILLNGEDVTNAIFNSVIAEATPYVASHAKIRSFLVKKQQESAQKGVHAGKAIVAEGRDTATRVFPEADLKIFLTASEQVRAKRRLAQFVARGEKEMTLEHVLEDIKDRDKRDRTRTQDPLVADPEAYGYVVVDNSALSEEETIRGIMLEVQKRGFIYE